MKWEEVRLQDICLSISDGDHQAPPKVNEGIPFVTISNITEQNVLDFTDTAFVPLEYYEKLDYKRQPQPNDILYSVVGSFGKAVFVKSNEKFVFQRHIAILRPDAKKVNPAFLYYVMSSKWFYKIADTLALGAAQRTISLTSLRNTKIALPPLAIQKRIAEILSRYDDLIENYQRQISLLEEAAQRLYKEWFVDLHFPGYENTPIVDGVPEGWEKNNIGETCETIGGGTPSTKVEAYYEGGHIKWVTPTDITRSNCLCLFDTTKKITDLGLKNSSAKMLPAEAILMTSRASVGFFGIYDCPVCTNQGFISCIPYNPNLQMYLLYNLMNRVDEIRTKAGGSTYLEIRKSVFRDLDIVIPTNNLLVTFQRQAHKILESTRTIAHQINLLTEARDRLLPKLMNGEFEV